MAASDPPLAGGVVRAERYRRNKDASSKGLSGHGDNLNEIRCAPTGGWIPCRRRHRHLIPILGERMAFRESRDNKRCTMKDMNARTNIGQLFTTACAVEETGRDGFQI